MASPAIAMGPTPRPMNMLSIILYNEVTTLAMIAGREYCTSSLPIGFVPRVSALDESVLCDDISLLFLCKVSQNFATFAIRVIFIIMDITKIKGALFDLDGVLIDIETLYTEFWKETGRRYGRQEPDFAYIIKGTTLNDILSTYFTPEQYEPLVKEIHDFENTMVYPVFP